jgi:hypothetical protein
LSTEETIDKKSNNLSFFYESYKKTIFFILITLFFTQIGFFIYAISQNVDNWAIIFSKDNDAANGIRLAQYSDWLTDNKYYNYGNLYFRISHTLQKLNPFILVNQENIFSEKSDQIHHFILMFVSYISMTGLSFLVSNILTTSKNKFMISSLIINSIFMSSTYWISKVFGVHPDLLLCFFIGLSVYSTAKYISSKNDNMLFISAITWGITLAIKLSSLFYMPILLVLFLKPFNKENIIKAFKFFSIILITFFIIGFPQNFQFIKIYEFVKYQSAFSIAPTIESFNEWWFLIYKQYIPFLPFIFIISIFLSDKNNMKMNKNELLQLFLITFLPFLFFLQRNITSPHEHYTLPIVAGLLVFTSIFFINLKYYLIEKRNLSLNFNNLPSLTVFFVIGVFIINIIPNITNSLLAKDLECRDEARNLYNIIKTYQSQKLKTHVDPYVPFNQGLGYIRNNWFKELKDISPGNADVLVLSKNYYNRYLTKEESHYIKQDTNNFNEVKKFYETFHQKKLIKDIYNQEWQKIAEYSCGWEIWVRKNNSISQ